MCMYTLGECIAGISTHGICMDPIVVLISNTRVVSYQTCSDQLHCNYTVL